MKPFQPNNLKTKKSMNEQTSMFVICVEGIMYLLLLLYILIDCTFKMSSLFKVLFPAKSKCILDQNWPGML